MYDTDFINAWGEEITPQFADLHGRPVERTPFSHPYNFDQYVTWKSKDYDSNKIYSGEYSDRMMEWDRKKYCDCIKEVFGNERQYFDNRKPEDIEKFLIKYFGHDLTLVAVEKACNWSTGYPIWVFHFESHEN